MLEARRLSLAITLVALLPVFCLEDAYSLPWDEDLYKQESYKPNELVRAPAKGSVPRGFEPFTLTNEEAAETLVNPVPGDEVHSVWRGQRLWNANCYSCHGATGAGEGSVGPMVGAPSLLDDFYMNRTDGRVFATIYNGGANMPRYGYKFSHAEIWDIVNYLRFLQGREVPHIVRPPKYRDPAPDEKR